MGTGDGLRIEQFQPNRNLGEVSKTYHLAPPEIPYNTRMGEDLQVDADKFDAVLRRLINSKPISKAEISVKIKAEREAKRVQKMDKPRPKETDRA